MLKSMTGYGKGETVSPSYGRFTVEVHSVNRKYCDVIINLPKQLLILESKIREIIQKDITRGRINVYISHPKEETKTQKLTINTELAKQYINGIDKIKKELNLKGELDLNLLSGLKEIIIHTDFEINPERVWNTIEKALRKAINAFRKMRIKEGDTIAHQIEKPLKEIEKYLGKVRNLVPKLIKHFKNKLEKKLKEVNINVSNADERVQKEVAIVATHMDITEEINRMESHIKQFKSLVKKNEPVGRTLDFLLQEMMREINTMGSKAVHTEISTYAIYIKSQLEKIREQIQNIE